MRTVSVDRGDEHDDRHDGGHGCGGPWPGRAHVAATQARRGAAAAAGRGPGAGLAFARRDGRDALGLYPFLLKLYADAGYQGAKFQDGLKAVCRTVNVEIVRRRDLHKFVVLPRRWIVERTIAWLNRCRRLAKDWECRNRSALAFLRWASTPLAEIGDPPANHAMNGRCRAALYDLQ
jgi:transposase